MGKLGNFDLNEQQRKLELQKYERRMALRAQFWKDMTNPNRHGSGEGGFMFDPAFYRFNAMRASHAEHFKPTGKATFWGFAILIAPLTIMYKFARSERDERERKYRNGEVSYADRDFKFV